MSKYIDADALIRRCRDKASPLDIISKGYRGVNVLSVGEINRIVDGMPAVDVEPVRHGEWISDKYAYEHCSACGFEWDEAEYVSNFRDTVNYCPNCGCKMDGGSEQCSG